MISFLSRLWNISISGTFHVGSLIDASGYPGIPFSRLLLRGSGSAISRSLSRCGLGSPASLINRFHYPNYLPPPTLEFVGVYATGYLILTMF